MTTFGRIVVAVLVAGVLISVTVVAIHYWGGDEGEELPLPKPPAFVETPGSSEELGRGLPATLGPVATGTRAVPSGQGPVGENAAGTVGGPPTVASTAPGAAAPAGSTAAMTPPPTPAGAGLPAAAGSPAGSMAGPAGGPAQVPPSPAEAMADEALAMMRDRPIEAQKRLSEALRAGIDGPKGQEVRQALNVLADRIQLSTQTDPRDPFAKAYKVASGDTLIGIGQRHLIPYELVMRLNRLGSPSIMAGQVLKVLQGPVHVEIYKGRKELQVWLGEVCLRTYPIGIGAANKTPEGTFAVKSKMKNPPYQPQHKSRSEHRASGAPDNPLGSRWIDIGNHYGIHGTIDPSSIGRDVSEGCIRMHNKDVEELYDMVTTATKVTIRP